MVPSYQCIFTCPNISQRLLTYQTHLTVGICPNLETEGRMSRTNPHSHLYFSGQIPMVSLFWGKKNKYNFRPILSPFLATLTSSIFFIFNKILFEVPYFFLWGGGRLKNPKIGFDQFSRYFRQLWATFIFSVDNFFLGTLFFLWGGGRLKNPKILFDWFSHHFAHIIIQHVNIPL